MGSAADGINLEDRTAIVVGGAGGIGAAVTETLAAAGAAVATPIDTMVGFPSMWEHRVRATSLGTRK